MSLPRFIVLKAPHDQKYLRYKHQNGNYNGYAEFTETKVVETNAKFAVEFAKDGLVHIRSCTKNKYLERTHNPYSTKGPKEEYWIAITADKPEEDRSKESCTLFEPIFVRDKKYQFRHAQSECYLRLRSLAAPADLHRCVLANHKLPAKDNNDIFEVIDWESLVILTQYVAFKGNNDMFLRFTDVGGTQSSEFSSGDVGDHSVTMEVFHTENGDIRIKPFNSDKFWCSYLNRIGLCSDDTIDTHFRAFKVDSKTIALRNVGNSKFCKRDINRVTTNILSASGSSITKEAYLGVLEPVLSRTIYNLRFDTENARVYNEKVLVVAQNSATNRTTQASTLEVNLSYSETNTSTWQCYFTLGLQTKDTFQDGVPFISETGVEISYKYKTDIEWGNTKTMTTKRQVTHQVSVPPMTKVTVYLKMTNGTCDVPFEFTKRDTLYDGTFDIIDVLGNTFTGTNYYNIQYDTKEEPLTSGNKQINIFC